MPIPFHSGTKKESRQIILGIIESECCTLECLRCLSFKDIEGTKNEFTSIRSMVNERNYILSYLKDNTSTPNGINNYKTVFRIKGTPVCKQAWIQVHGINERRFDRIYSDFKTGSKVYVHGNTGLKRRSNKTSQCIAWLTFLVNSIGDQQPDSGKVHLPSCFTKLALYQKMICELGCDDSISKSQFYNIMEKEFAHVSIPKVTDILGCTFMSCNKQSRKYLTGRSYKNNEFDWPFLFGDCIIA